MTENPLEYDEWTQNRFTREARQRFETAAKVSFQRLMQACQKTDDATVKGIYLEHKNAMQMLRVLHGKAFDYQFLKDEKEGQ